MEKEAVSSSKRKDTCSDTCSSKRQAKETDNDLFARKYSIPFHGDQGSSVLGNANGGSMYRGKYVTPGIKYMYGGQLIVEHIQDIAQHLSALNIFFETEQMEINELVLYCPVSEYQHLTCLSTYLHGISSLTIDPPAGLTSALTAAPTAAPTSTQLLLSTEHIAAFLKDSYTHCKFSKLKCLSLPLEFLSSKVCQHLQSMMWMPDQVTTLTITNKGEHSQLDYGEVLTNIGNLIRKWPALDTLGMPISMVHKMGTVLGIDEMYKVFHNVKALAWAYEQGNACSQLGMDTPLPEQEEYAAFGESHVFLNPLFSTLEELCVDGCPWKLLKQVKPPLFAPTLTTLQLLEVDMTVDDCRNMARELVRIVCLGIWFPLSFADEHMKALLGFPAGQPMSFTKLKSLHLCGLYGKNNINQNVLQTCLYHRPSLAELSLELDCFPSRDLAKVICTKHLVSLSLDYSRAPRISPKPVVNSIGQEFSSRRYPLLQFLSIYCPPYKEHSQALRKKIYTMVLNNKLPRLEQVNSSTTPEETSTQDWLMWVNMLTAKKIGLGVRSVATDPAGFTAENRRQGDPYFSVSVSCALTVLIYPVSTTVVYSV
jgi:hypothetical protein